MIVNYKADREKDVSNYHEALSIVHKQANMSPTHQSKTNPVCSAQEEKHLCSKFQDSAEVVRARMQNKGELS